MQSHYCVASRGKNGSVQTFKEGKKLTALHIELFQLTEAFSIFAEDRHRLSCQYFPIMIAIVSCSAQKWHKLMSIGSASGWMNGDIWRISAIQN